MPEGTSLPVVTVIIPTFMRANYVSAAIQSVLNQTFQDFEIIVIDDASPDHTREVVKAFGDPRIRYIRNDGNVGEAASRNTGIRNSRGKYIALLDDDDEWYPDKLQAQIDLLERSPDSIGVVYSGYDLFEDGNSFMRKRSAAYKGDLSEEILFRNLLGVASTVVVKKSVLNKVGLFDEKIAYGIDHDLWIRIARDFEFDYVERALVRYRLHPDRMSNKLALVIKGNEDRIGKYAKEYHSRRKPFSKKLLSLGIWCCYLGELKKARSYLIGSISMNPFQTRAYINLLLSLLGANIFVQTKEILKRFRQGPPGNGS